MYSTCQEHIKLAYHLASFSFTVLLGKLTTWSCGPLMAIVDILFTLTLSEYQCMKVQTAFAGSYYLWLIPAGFYYKIFVS